MLLAISKEAHKQQAPCAIWYMLHVYVAVLHFSQRIEGMWLLPGLTGKSENIH